MNEARWHDLGSVEELAKHRLRQITIGRTKIALSCKEGRFGAISGACNHVGGPLGEGHHDGEAVRHGSKDVRPLSEGDVVSFRLNGGGGYVL